MAYISPTKNIAQALLVRVRVRARARAKVRARVGVRFRVRVRVRGKMARALQNHMRAHVTSALSRGRDHSMTRT